MHNLYHYYTQVCSWLCMYYFADVLFFSNKSYSPSEDHDRFCSLSIIEQDVSLILDSSVIER